MGAAKLFFSLSDWRGLKQYSTTLCDWAVLLGAASMLRITGWALCGSESLWTVHFTLLCSTL